jgi:Flp pilus assembly protein CpaB
MTYRLRNITIAIALALVAALLTSFYVANYQKDVRKNEANVSVFVAKNDIPAGISGNDIARKGMLVKSEVARRTVVPGSISTPTQLDSLVTTEPIYAGEQVSTRRFATPSERGIAAQLKGPMRAFQLPGDQHQLLAGTLKAGDRVDVIGSMKLDGNSEVFATRVILRDIEVLQSSGSSGAAAELAEPTTNLSVLLAVTDTQVQKLFHVSKHGDWSLDLRPTIKASDSAETVQFNRTIMRDGLRGAQLALLEAGGNR